MYETPKAVDEYLLFHYAEDKELMPYKGGPTVTSLPPRPAQRPGSSSQPAHGAGPEAVIDAPPSPPPPAFPQDALQFPARCAALCALHCKTKQGNRRALDVGCAVGRSAFEL